jgi:outer membrane lipoprotein-sorting protein
MMRLFSLGGMLLILLLTGCTQSGSIPVTAEDQQEIEKYIGQEVMSVNFGGEIFSEYEILGSDQKKSELYIWALIEEYYKEGSKMELGTGMSVPMVLKVDQTESPLKVLSHTQPRDGSFYADDLKDMFPYFAEMKALDYPTSHIDKLVKEIEAKVDGK